MYNTLLKTKSESPNYNTPFYVENVGGQNTFTIHKYMVSPNLSLDIPALTIEYSYDNIIWYSLGEIAENVYEWSRTIDFDDNERIYVRSENSKFEGSSTIINFTCSAPFNAGGNLLSLNYGIHYNEYDTAISHFQKLFLNSTMLVDSSKLYLPKTGNIQGTFSYMFNGCTSLLSTPVLPKGQVAYSAFNNMFQGCTSLTYTPDLSNVIGMAKAAVNMFNGCTALKAIGDSDSIASYMYYGCTSIIDASRAKFVGGYSSYVPGYMNLQPSGRYAFYGCTSLKILPEFTGNLGDFNHAFAGCTALEESPDFSNCTVTNGCRLDYMFENCTSLTTINTLPTWSTWSSTVSGAGLFKGMFKGCTALEEFTQSLGSGVGGEAYAEMFSGCTSLESVPQNLFTGTAMGWGQCSSMFANCTSLKTAPNLPATSSEGNACYNSMFYGCTSLTTPPTINVTTFSGSDSYAFFDYMFYGCTSLTSMPQLPVINKNYRISSMFQNCTSLVNTVTMPKNIYMMDRVFSGCTSLTTFPTFQSGTTVTGTAEYAFYGCTGLTSADLSNVVFNTNINSLFNNCSSLNSVTIGNIGKLPSNKTNWMNGVAATGIFTYTATSSVDITTYGVPSGWTGNFIPLEMRDNPFYFKNEDSQAISITVPTGKGVKYSKDNGQTWTTINASSMKINLEVGESALARCSTKFDNQYYQDSQAKYVTSTGSYSIGGDICFMKFGDNYVKGEEYTVEAYFFQRMFANSATLVSISNLIVPDDVQYGQHAFNSTFLNCTGLVNASTTLKKVDSPSQYYRMFYGCTSLTTAPSLPSTTLADYCYNAMFQNCTSLETAPELPATTLAKGCYYQMFYGCTSLNYIKVHFTSWPTTSSASSALNSTLYWTGLGVDTTGTFVCPTALPQYFNASGNSTNNYYYTGGTNTIPYGWTVQTF